MSIKTRNRVPEGICSELKRRLDYNYEIFFSSKDEVGLFNDSGEVEYVPFRYCPFCGSKIVGEFIKGRGVVWRYETEDERFESMVKEISDTATDVGD